MTTFTGLPFPIPTATFWPFQVNFKGKNNKKKQSYPAMRHVGAQEEKSFSPPPHPHPLDIGWVDPRACLGAEARRKSSAPVGDGPRSSSP